MATLKQGDSGAAVSELQQMLVENGFAVSQDELTSQTYGPTTMQGVMAFQGLHVGSDGTPLTQDGVAGPETQWALNHPGGGDDPANYKAQGWTCDLANAIPKLQGMLQWAQDQIGTHEQPDGSNRGPKIDDWIGMAGQPTSQAGPPWCAYFVSAAFHQAEGGSPFGTLASAYKILNWGQTQGRCLTPTAPMQPGDVFVIMRAQDHGHVGLICGVTSDGKALTIEGNAGNACRGLIRTRDSFAAVVRPVT